MVITSKQLTDGAKIGGSFIGGTALLGPTLGPPAAGVAVNYLTDSDKGRWFAAAGVGAGIASLFAGGGGSGRRGSHTPAHRRGWK